MAGAGQPWYMPLTWPVGHVTNAVTRPSDEKPDKPTATPELDLVGHLTSIAAASRSFVLALLCIYGLYDENQYPAFGPAKTLQWAWMWPIILRNVLGAWIICGFWDWFLYFSPLAPKLHKFKLNPVYPTKYQMAHDAVMTTSAVLTAAACEILMCYLWASGAVTCNKDLWAFPIWTLLWGATITHWRIPHFWAIHRGMHPWFNRKHGLMQGDIGAFLYRHVHSLHHKSHNPTALSGTNMHPVESTGYFSAAFICVPFGCHPAVFLGCIIDCAVGAWLGHDGFQWPGSGDYFHQLHHAHFDCNYGAMHVPVDKWLGTFAEGKKDVTSAWGSENPDDLKAVEMDKAREAARAKKSG